ncbi:MAG: hypothetical protein ABEK59_05580 [Halobacteria archaeon]
MKLTESLGSLTLLALVLTLATAPASASVDGSEKLDNRESI